MVEARVLDHVAIPNESYIGNEGQVLDVRRWLDDRRKIPINTDFMRSHIAKLKLMSPEDVPLSEVHSLDSILRAEEMALSGIDIGMLQIASSNLDERLKRASQHVTILNPERYFLGVLDQQSGGTGGFFSKYSMGFQYLSYFGFANLLTGKATTNPAIMTLDLIRNYLHDSIHAATYRNFAKNTDASSREPVYRHQYGLNFRTPDGKSYSAPNLTEQHSPYAINLNLLMDGLTMLVVADETRKVWNGIPNKPQLNRLEQEILDGILYPAGSGAEENKLGHNFNRNVARRTQEFLKYWEIGNEGQLRDLFFDAMIAGQLGNVKAYFEQSLPKALAREEQQSNAGQLQRKPLFDYINGRKQYNNAWEQLFKSTDWIDLLQKK